ncbi:MAG: PilZ domain-containing protein [Proteobacteria bacterium]|nr:PilZ domain-containing protein [Pseudomonadota bacterium]
MVMLTENRLDRRFFERFKVLGPAYAAIGPGFERMGHIINISRSGIAFNYIQHAGTPAILGESFIQISDNFQVISVMPFISILDDSGDLPDPHSSVEIRCHRGRFGPLSRNQLDTLIGFLEEKTQFELIKN